MHNDQLDRIERKLNMSLYNMRTLMAAIDDLKAAVAAERSVTESVVTLLTELSKELKDAIASGDPAAIESIAKDISDNTQKLADAVTANTPTPQGT